MISGAFEKVVGKLRGNYKKIVGKNAIKINVGKEGFHVHLIFSCRVSCHIFMSYSCRVSYFSPFFFQPPFTLYPTKNSKKMHSFCKLREKLIPKKWVFLGQKNPIMAKKKKMVKKFGLR